MPNEGGGPDGGSKSCDGVIGRSASALALSVGGANRGVEGKEVEVGATRSDGIASGCESGINMVLRTSDRSRRPRIVPLFLVGNVD